MQNHEPDSYGVSESADSHGTTHIRVRGPHGWFIAARLRLAGLPEGEAAQ